MLKKASNDGGLCPEKWAEVEFGGAELGDRRLVERLKKVAACFLRQPSASIPKACGEWSQVKAAYRLFARSKMEPSAFIEPHCRQTLARVAAQPVVLVVQDSTGLNFSGGADLGLIGSGADGAKGLWVHT